MTSLIYMRRLVFDKWRSGRDYGLRPWSPLRSGSNKGPSTNVAPSAAKTRESGIFAAGGAAGIRTLDELLAHTHFPGERLRPLGHRSACLEDERPSGGRGLSQGVALCKVGRMRKFVLLPLLLAAAPAPVIPAKPAPSPNEIVAAAPASDWVAIAASDLLVMDLAPDPGSVAGAGAKGKPRRVVIQLMPPPFSQGWIGNIRKLAAAHWWDGTSVNRVQDNYVVQWGDATEKKALPAGLATVGEGAYISAVGPLSEELSSSAASADIEEGEQLQSSGKSGSEAFADMLSQGLRKLEGGIEEENRIARISIDGTNTSKTSQGWHERDPFSGWVEFFKGWPIASNGDNEAPDFWPVHCYAMVGVGRNLSPDTGSGAELYTVIGHAPRHLDRNIALVGRVIEGVEHLSSLPRGTGALGFYETAEDRVPITSIRMMSEMETDKPLPRYEYLSTESESFERYADARANRRDPFFNVPAGGADICNIPVPVRRRV